MLIKCLPRDNNCIVLFVTSKTVRNFNISVSHFWTEGAPAADRSLELGFNRMNNETAELRFVFPLVCSPVLNQTVLVFLFFKNQETFPVFKNGKEMEIEKCSLCSISRNKDPQNWMSSGFFDSSLGSLTILCLLM